MSSILVIDHSVSAAKLLELALTRGGYQVQVARDVSSGRKAVEATDFDLVILDVFLSDGSGLDVLRHLRQQLRNDVPVLVLSGHRQEDFSVRALRIGATAYVTKPFSPRELLAEVDRLVARAGVA